MSKKHKLPKKYIKTKDKIKVMKHYARGGAIEVAYSDESFYNWYNWNIEDEPEWNWEMVHYRIKDGS